MKAGILTRRAVLLQLEAASPASVPPETILLGLKICGVECSEKELAAILDYLSEKNFAVISRSEISASHMRAKLSAKGRDFLESGGF